MSNFPLIIGESTFEKHRNPKHASLKMKAMNVSDCMDLAQLGNTEADYSNVYFKGCSIKEELDVLMERDIVGSILVGDWEKNFNCSVPEESSMK